MPWLELSLIVRTEQQPGTEEALDDLGALSITLQDANAETPDEQAIFEPGVGELPLWPTITLNALFDEHADRRGLSAALCELLPWLASWLGLALDERWPEEQRRALILAAVDLYQWRGTRHGLSEFLRLYTGFTPEITEHGVGRRGVTAADAFKFTVRLRVPDPALVDRAVVEAIIETEKPAHTGYALEIVAA